MCMHLEARGQPSAVQVELSNLFLRHCFSLSRNLPARDSPVSASTVLGLQAKHTAPGLLPGLLGIYPSLHVCKASTLSTELSALS